MLIGSGFVCVCVHYLDEAHERTINTDVLFGLMEKCSEEASRAQIDRHSATFGFRQISEYFFQAPIFRIPGRTFPVEFCTQRSRKRLFGCSLDYCDANSSN